jgi:hypothetical protein
VQSLQKYQGIISIRKGLGGGGINLQLEHIQYSYLGRAAIARLAKGVEGERARYIRVNYLFPVQSIAHKVPMIVATRSVKISTK